MYLNTNQNTVVKVKYILILSPDITKEECNFNYFFNNFNYFFNNSSIKSRVLNSGNEIILTSWPSEKDIECKKNNDIPVKIPSLSYVLADRSVLCNCEIETENHFLLESLAACSKSSSKLTMYFTIKLAFVNALIIE